MQERTTRVNASEGTIKMIGQLGIRFLLTGIVEAARLWMQV